MDNELGALLLETEKAVPVGRPAWEDVEDVIRLLGPRANGFVTLGEEGAGYVQAAGTSSRMTIEFRKETGSGGFRHCVLGVTAEAIRETSVNTASGRIRLMSNEVLSATEALEIFRAFFESRTVPAHYTQRDTTAMFQGGSG
jgi:hypothetical protein